MSENLIKYFKLCSLIISIVLLNSCDAIVLMTYSVENKTSSEIKIFVPNFPTDSVLHVFCKRKDSTIVIKPNEEIVVGIEKKNRFSLGDKKHLQNTTWNLWYKEI